MRKYAETHEWIEVKDGIATIGISTHAADEMGDLTYIELPEIGKEFKAGEPFGTVESVKAASEIFAPVDGIVCEINTALEDDPASLNKSPEEDGWICKFKNVDEAALDNLMTQAEYLKSVEK